MIFEFEWNEENSLIIMEYTFKQTAQVLLSFAYLQNL